MQPVVVLLVSGFIASALAANGKIAKVPNCNCEGLQCSCCTSFNFLKESRRACMNVGLDKNERQFNVALLMDDRTIKRKIVNGPNMEPFCANALVQALPLRLCVNTRNARITETVARFCATMESKSPLARVFRSPLPCFVQRGDSLVTV